MREVSPVPKFVLAVETNQEFGFEDVQYALVEVTPDDARWLIARCELAERLKDGEGGDASLYCLEYWWYGPRYFASDQVAEGTELPDDGEYLPVPDCFEIIGRTEDDEAAGHYDIRTDLDCVRVVPDRGGRGTVVEFTASVRNTDCGITSCELPLSLLREIAADNTDRIVSPDESQGR